MKQLERSRKEYLPNLLGFGRRSGGGGAPAITVDGYIDGQPLVGVAGLVSEPTVSGSISTAYQWYRGDPAAGGTTIGGATSATYTPVQADYTAAPLVLYRRATYTNATGDTIDDLAAPAVTGATYAEDWTSYTAGNTWTQLDTLYNRTAAGIDATVIASAISPSGKAVRVDATTSNVRQMWLAAAATFGLAEDTDTDTSQGLFLFTHTGTNAGRYNIGLVDNPLTWIGPRLTVYANNARFQIDSEDPNATTGTSWTSALTPGTSYWFRIEQEGTTARYKLWEYGTAEPSAWFTSRTITTAVAQPAPSFGARFASAYPAAQYELHYWSGSYNCPAPYWSGFVPPVEVSTDPMTFAASAAATTFAQNDGDIDWNFASINQGRYANGDPFLVNTSGLSLTSITPASQDSAGRWINGAMENPGESGFPTQGFDSYASSSNPNTTYSATDNIDPGRTGSAYVLTSGLEASLVKVISNATPDATFGRDRLTYGGVMTICAVEPTANAFRPGIAAPSKISKWLEDDLIDLTTLRNLTAPGSMLPVAQILGAQRWAMQTWNDNNDNGWHMTPTQNQQGYGSDYAADVATAVLALSTNITLGEKRDLAVALVQRGIDIFERLEVGGNFDVNGGGWSGKKGPLAVAAFLLDDADMKAYLGPAVGKFVEDDQYVNISAGDIASYGYPAGDLGGPEWQIDPGGLSPDPSTGASYRNVNLRWQIGMSLGIQLLGAKTVWNNTPFFDYTDRVMERTFNNGSGTSQWALSLSGTNSPPQFHRDMWSSFRSAAGMPAIWNW